MFIHMLYMIFGCFYKEEGARREPVGGGRRGKFAPRVIYVCALVNNEIVYYRKVSECDIN